MARQPADPAIIAEVNEVTNERLILAAQEAELTRQFRADKDALEADFARQLTELHLEIKPVDERLWALLQKHRNVLIAPGKQSFITMAAKFQFKKESGKERVTDSGAVMETARLLGIVRQIADPPKGGWRYNTKKFWSWLEQRGEMREHFADQIEVTQDTEGLTIYPNSNYTVLHDLERVSPPPVSIKSPSSATAES